MISGKGLFQAGSPSSHLIDNVSSRCRQQTRSEVCTVVVHRCSTYSIDTWWLRVLSLCLKLGTTFHCT